MEAGSRGREWWRERWLTAVYVGLGSFSALMVIANKTTHLVVGGTVFAVMLAVVAGWVMWGGARVFASVWVVVICVAALLGVEEFHRPTQKVVHPGTAGLALIEPAKVMVRGGDPYTVRLWDGAEISPGPGWLVMLAPLTLSGGLRLLDPLLLAVAAWMLRRKEAAAGGRFAVLMMMLPIFLLLSTIGHDLMAIPLAFVVLCLLAEKHAESAGWVLGLAVVAGTFATSRVPMVALVMILGVGLWRVRRQTGAMFLCVALAVTAAWHGVFYAWARRDGVAYQPLHLFARAGNSGHGMTVLGAAGAVGVLVWVCARMRGEAREWMLAAGLLLAFAFVPVGVGELLRSGFAWKVWEGSNYVAFCLPLLCGAMVLRRRES